MSSYLSKKIFCKEKIIGRVNPGRGGVDYPPPQKIVGLKLCWDVVIFVRRGCIQNFRPLVFLVEVEFVVVWGGVGCCGV